MKRVAIVLLVASLLLATPVYAETDYIGDVYNSLINHGVSDIAAAAIVGNAVCESGGRPDAVQYGGPGIGIFQWSGKNRAYLQAFCATHSDHEKVTLKGYIVCNNVDCQVEFMLQDVSDRLSCIAWSRNYVSQCKKLDVLSDAVARSQIPGVVSFTHSADGFFESSSLEVATLQFLLDYETPSVTSCFWVGIPSLSETKGTQQGFINSYLMRLSAARDVYDTYAIVLQDVEGTPDNEVTDKIGDLVESLSDDIQAVEPSAAQRVARVRAVDAKPVTGNNHVFPFSSYMFHYSLVFVWLVLTYCVERAKRRGRYGSTKMF